MFLYTINKKILFSGLALVILSVLSFFILPPFLKNTSLQNNLYTTPQVGFTSANDFSTHLPYKGNYSYGMNPGYYGPKWSSQHTAGLAIGNSSMNIQGVGAKSLRLPLYDEFLTKWGLTKLVDDYKHFESLGAGEITAFVGRPHESHQLDSLFAGSQEKSKIFKGMYEPVWLDEAKTQINPNNTYAKYLYDVVKTYGKYVRFWEIVNEPDFTRSAGGWLGDFDPSNAKTWYRYNPTPAELMNLRAPIFYYIRMLRISWDVIKKLQPDDYVCTGGIGYNSFLDAILRNTDNPSDGSVSDQYPLKGGAYFDVLSFHSYPMFYLSGPGKKSKFTYKRNSDDAVDAFIMIKSNMDSLLKQYGYDGRQYPQKHFICTETGVSRIMNGDKWGSNEGQKNFMIKAHIASQKAGIRQLYWFQLGDQPDPNEQFSQMGLYYYFGDKAPYHATPADQGIAMKTTSDLLYGKTYDAQRTAALNLPPGADGAAFKGSDEKYTYVLWAKTTKDLSETNAASYQFPPKIISTANLLRKEWNFSQTDTSSVIRNSPIQLSASPSFFSETNTAINQNPVANAGADQNILNPTSSLVLKGKAADADGTIASYNWTQIAGPAKVTIENASQSQATVHDLQNGTYTFRLNVFDDKGAKGIDDVSVTLPIILPAKIEAENWVDMKGVKTETAFDQGSGMNVGWIDQGDWMEYTFFVPEAASYSITLRVATANEGGQVHIKNKDRILSTVNIPKTGAYQKWENISTTTRLNKGMQKIRLESSASPVWNLNWIQISPQ